MDSVDRNDVDSASPGDHASSLSPQLTKFSRPTPDSDKEVKEASPTLSRPKCRWCGKYLTPSQDDDASHSATLKEHMDSAHPHVVKFRAPVLTASEELQAGDSDDAIETGANSEEEHDHHNEGELDSAEQSNANDVDGVHGPDDAHSDHARETRAQHATADIEKRTHRLWDIHNPRIFSSDYDSETEKLERCWDTIFRGSTRSKSRLSGEFSDRPTPYKKSNSKKSEFLEITPVNEFLVQLRNPEMLSREELYAVTANAAHALKTWQDEYLAIDSLSKLASRNVSKHTADPRKPEQPEVFEDKKEAALYGYKYEAKPDKIGQQDPFIQGGFKPTPTQARKMNSKVTPGDPNPDGWPTISRFGIEYIPKFQTSPPEDFVGKQTRKRKAIETDAAKAISAKTAQNTPETQTPPEPEHHEPATRISKRTKTKPPPPSPKRQSARARNTRQAAASRSTPTATKAETRSATKSTRGRKPAPDPRYSSVRVRGWRSQGDRGRVSYTPDLNTEAEVPSHGGSGSLRVRGWRGQGGLGARGGRGAPARRIAAARAANDGQGRCSNISRATTPAKPVLIQACPDAPSISPGDSPSVSKPSAPTRKSSEDPDVVEANRQQKIANSKNPKRTAAMLNHWEKFIASGRIRNPKRSKEELEVARADKVAKKATEGPKTGGRKRKREGFDGINTAPISLKTDTPYVRPPLAPLRPAKPVKMMPPLSGREALQQGPLQFIQADPQNGKANIHRPFVYHSQTQPVLPPIHPAPIQHGPIQHGPIQPGPIQHAPIQHAPVQHVPVQHAPIQHAPIHPAPVHPAPVYPAPVHSVPYQPPPVHSAPYQPTPVHSSPYQPPPVHSAPYQPSPIHPAPIQPAPTQPPPFQTTPPTLLPPSPQSSRLPPRLPPMDPGYADMRSPYESPYPPRPNELPSPFPQSRPQPQPDPRHHMMYPPYPDYYMHYRRPSLHQTGPPGPPHGNF